MAFNVNPGFSFNESNVGVRPVRTVSFDRVGMVGCFNAAPASAQVLGPKDAEFLFGKDLSVGSVHLQALLDQNVPDVLVSPVHTAARKAVLATTFTGTAATGTGTMNVTIVDADAVSTTVTVATTVSQVASTVATNVAAALNANATFAALVVVTAPTGNTGTTGKLTFTAVDAGDAGNDITILFGLTTTTGLTGTTPSTIFSTAAHLAGGYDAPEAATATLADDADADVVTFTAVRLGTKVTVKTIVEASLDDDEDGTRLFNLTLTESYSGTTYTETYRNVDLTDVYDDDKLSATRNSRIATGVVESSTTLPELGSTTLTGGSDGDTAYTLQDFYTAIDAMEEFHCTIVVCPGAKPAGISQKSLDDAMLIHAEGTDTEMGELMGLRIFVGSMPKGTLAADMSTLKAASRIPDSKRCVMVVGWGTSTRQPKFTRYGVDGAALYAGHLVMTPTEVSPAAATSAPKIKGISEIDSPITVPNQNTLNLYRCDAIIKDPITGAFVVLNGRTTSSDPAWYWVCYRRVYDAVRTDIFFGFSWVKSEPMRAGAKGLDSQIENGVDAYLSGKVGSWLNGYSPTVSNDANNSEASRNAGQRFVDVYMEMVPPNDRTQWNLNREAKASIRLA